MKRESFPKKVILLLTLCILNVSVYGDRISNIFEKQVEVFPQERIHVHTDKSTYFVGEDIWFRVHLTDYYYRLPDTSSRYVYGELISPHNDIINRVKIRPNNGAYHGYINIPQELASGNYELRFYTRYTENIGEDYFYRKRINIGNPLSGKYHIDALFKTKNENNIDVELRFLKISDNTYICPDQVRIKNKTGQLQEYKLNNQNAMHFSVNPSKDIINNSVYVEFDYQSQLFKQFITVPNPDGQYVVSFFPEGGNLPAGAPCRMAFKALNPNGMGEMVTGYIINPEGDTIENFKSNYLGMGSFPFKAYVGETYTAVCRNSNGIEKKFILPQAQDNAISINATMGQDSLRIALRRTSGMTLPKSMRLIIHYRGEILYNKQWDTNPNYIWFEREKIPSGVINILLVDADNNPISERLIFNWNEKDFVHVTPVNIKNTYTSREKIPLTFNISDYYGNSLKGNFSISVTDNNDIVPDTMNNILSTMLLTSEIKGYIENPGYYLRGDSLANKELDALLMTQGWRRYDIPSLLKEKVQKPKYDIEIAPIISGTVKSGSKKSAGNNIITIMAMGSKSFVSTTKTNHKGHFVFNDFDFPDSTTFVVQATTPKWKKGSLQLTMDEEKYPEISQSILPLLQTRNNATQSYTAKAEEKFIQDNGSIWIQSISVIGKKISRAEEVNAIYTSPFNPSIQPEKYPDIENTIRFLGMLPGVYVKGTDGTDRGVIIRKQGFGGGSNMIVIIDGRRYEADFLYDLPLNIIEQVELITGPGMAIFGLEGGNAAGALIVTTKKGAYTQTPDENITSITPLGYQKPKEFYSPVYETTQQKKNSEPDLRTTIYWNPNVQIDNNGVANVDFYSADSSTEYSVIIEGITANGQIIYNTDKLKIK